MNKVTIVGVDLAKPVFQLHGAAADGTVVFRKKLSRAQLLSVSGGAAALHRGHGGLRDRTPLGPGDRTAWLRGPADPAGLRKCEEVRER